MLSRYASPLLSAVALFPTLAGLFTLPFMIHQYRKYGSIPFLRILAIYLFIFYLLCAYFLVILPLPSIEEVASYTSATYNLIPFKFIGEFVTKTNFSLLDPKTWLSSFSNFIFLEPLFNIVLTIPFGFFLRYYFGYSWKKTVVYSFLLSLFFELTQLTGLYGIYPRSYRLFDVNDLINNTLGGFLGWHLEALFRKLIPTRQRLDAVAYDRGQNVTYLRRIVALCFDGFLLLSINGIIFIFFNINDQYSWLIPLINFLLVTIIVYFLKGSTLGKRIVKIKLVNTADSSNPSFLRLLLRYSIMFLWMIEGMPIALFMTDLSGGIGIILLFAWCFSWGYLLIDMVKYRNKGKLLRYEKWSGTSNINMVVSKDANE